MHRRLQNSKEICHLFNIKILGEKPTIGVRINFKGIAYYSFSSIKLPSSVQKEMANTAVIYRLTAYPTERV